MNNKKIYTIGYTLFQDRNGINLENLFMTLKKYNIDFLIDIRSVPFSKQYPQCNADNLKAAGNQFGIRYIHMPELGAKASPILDVFSKASDIFFEKEVFPISKTNRPEKEKLNANDEIVDFNKFRHEEHFQDGLKRIETAYDKNFTLALMCSEKNPMDCHRYFLISKALEQKFGDWLSILHIVQNRNGHVYTVTNRELDIQLKDEIFNKEVIKKMNIYNSTFNEEFKEIPPKIYNYYGNNNINKANDFCDRYWNLIHGWKKPNSINNNKYENYD